MGGGGPIPHDDYISWGDESDGDNPHPEYKNFDDDYKNGGYFSNERDGIFYYCIFAHKIWAYVHRDGEGWKWRDDRDGISGGSDILISGEDMGNWADLGHSKESDEVQTFMHELGHCLGLNHCNNEFRWFCYCAMRQSGSYEANYCSDCWDDLDLSSI